MGAPLVRRGLRLTSACGIVLGIVSACSSGERPDDKTEKTGSIQEAITTGCTAEHIGAPCDPDGSAVTYGECDGTCTIVLGGGGVAVPACTKVTASTNDNKVCGTSATAKSDCNKICKAGLCVSLPAPDGTACRPSDFGGSICDGQCVKSTTGTGMTCVALGTTERCPANKPGDCVYNFCDATRSKTCVTYKLPVTSVCDDGNPCTTGDKCDSSSVCVGSNAPAGTACPVDGDPCTRDVCDGSGKCTHPAVDCDDKDACTADSCSSSAGGCIHAKKVCPSDVCHAPTCDSSTGACGLKAITCDDLDPCTTDTCDVSKGGCVFTPIPGCGDAGTGDTGTTDTGSGGTDTGSGGTDTGSGGTDTGSGGTDTGSGGTDTGTTGTDSGTPGEDSGSTGGDSGSSGGDSASSIDSGGSGLDGAGADTGNPDDVGPQLAGGCGCRTAGEESSTPSSALALAGLAVVVARVRRRRDRT